MSSGPFASEDTMALRLVQRGTGECRDLCVLYYLSAGSEERGRYIDRRVCAAAPRAIIVNDTREAHRTDEYRYVEHGGILSVEQTIAWALEHARALAVDRVILASYSAGYKAVRALLRDRGPRDVDAVVTCDGCHALDPPADWQIEVWRQLAADARAGERVWIASHTQIVPPSYLGTRAVLELATGRELSGEEARLYEAGLQIWSYPGTTRREHEHQCQVVMAQMLQEALAALDSSLPGVAEARPVSSPPAAPESDGGETPPSARPDGPGPARPILSGATTLAAAVHARALADLAAGVREHPSGSNRGPEVDACLRAQGVDPPASWCAARLSQWIREGAADLGVVAPVAGSPGAQALGAQFRAAGRWVGRHAIVPALHLLPGNVPIWRRGPPGDWRGHAGVCDAGSTNTVMATIEANSGPRGDCVYRSPWSTADGRLTERRLNDPRLLGIGLCTTPEEQAGAAAIPHVPTQHELAEAARLMALGAELMSEGEPRDPLADLEERLAKA